MKTLRIQYRDGKLSEFSTGKGKPSEFSTEKANSPNLVLTRVIPQNSVLGILYSTVIPMFHEYEKWHIGDFS